MFVKNINPIHTKSWQELQKHFEKIKNISISDLFDQDENRFNKFSINFLDQILVDFSKNNINEITLKKLINLAKEMDVKNAIKNMFNGKKINKTENNPVLHTALRNITNKPIFINNHNIMIEINLMLNKMKDFSEKIINGYWKGYDGNQITDIVNIGIGGSYLGPNMVTEALRPYKNHLNIHFISNIDGTNIVEILKKIKPENTIFLISSKTFTTKETITNANSVKKWFFSKIKYSKYVMEKHFIGISANTNEVIKFGINKNNIFNLWSWVGGRYSLWSSIGLVIMLSIGYKNFYMLLKGAYTMDQHFLNTSIKKNIPIILALIGIWYNNFFCLETEAVLIYDQYMHKFISYLQQSNMESNGKSIDRNGRKINYQTGPIIWGGIGTNAQHSFYQLLHQGTKIVPCDFIAPINTHNPINNHDHHIQLISNFFAQTKALAFGKSYEIVEKEFNKFKTNKNFLKNNISYKTFEGNRPTNSILIRKIDPFNLGALISLYEHKIFIQGTILNIFSFDQWGVELGKELTDNIQVNLNTKKSVYHYDSSTNGLINFYKLFF